MKLFALADLHLAGSVDKPMDIFGSRWRAHVEQIVDNWTRQVGPEDTVLIGGDISWAKSLDEALSDLTLLHQLPGRKILLRGNHDYWWTTIRKLEAFCQAQGLTSLHFLRNDACPAAGFYICGTRGWLLPSDSEFSSNDEKILRREMIRLELSLKALEQLKKRTDGLGASVALMHYPPITEKGEGSDLSRLLSDAGLDLCLFGHIHHDVPFYDSRPKIDGVRYIMVASDQIDFSPLLIGEDGQINPAVEGGE